MQNKSPDLGASRKSRGGDRQPTRYESNIDRDTDKYLKNKKNFAYVAKNSQTNLSSRNTNSHLDL